MYLYSKTFIHHNKEAKLIALACLLFGGLFFAVGNANLLPMPAIAQLLGFALIATAVYIAAAFLLRQYTVAVIKNNREEGSVKELYDLTVSERKGKKLIKVCHIGLNNIISVDVVTKENKKEKKKQNSDAYRFTYDTKFLWKRRIEIVAETGDYKSLVYLSFDDELLRFFKGKYLI